MVLAVYLVTCWLVVGLLAFIKRSISNREIGFYFLFFTLMNSHLYEIVAAIFKAISFNDDPNKYIAYTLYKCFVVPLVLTFFFVLVFNTTGRIARFMQAVGMLLLIGTFEWFNTSEGLVTYAKWSIHFSLIFITLLMILGFLCHKVFKRLGWT